MQPTSKAFSVSAPPMGGGEPAAAIDTHDDDLGWIIERLVEKVGGSFGIVSRQLGPYEEPVILAGCGLLPPDAGSTLLAVVHSRAEPSTIARRRDDAPRISQLSHHSGGDPQSSWRLMCLSFSPAPDLSVVATVCREDANALFGPLQEMVAAVLYPVLARYIRLWWLHRLERQRARALSDALDLADVGVVILDRRAEVLFSNSRADSLLEERDGIRRYGRTIVAAGAVDGAALQAALQRASQRTLSASLTTGANKSSSVLSLTRPTPRRPLLVTIMSVEGLAIDPSDPSVLIYLIDPDQDLERLVTPFCRANKLTPAESRLLYYLVGGARLQSAAAKMGIQPATARAYLKQVFQKTQTNRQAELVRVTLSSAMRVHVKLEAILA